MLKTSKILQKNENLRQFKKCKFYRAEKCNKNWNFECLMFLRIGIFVHTNFKVWNAFATGFSEFLRSGKI
jgi:hypothetical protein